MQMIMDSLAPLISLIAKDLITFMVAALILVYGLVKTKILAYIKNEMLHRIASEGFALAETKYSNFTSDGKLNAAASYTEKKLKKVGIKITADEIRAAIEKAVVEYNVKK